MRLEIGPAAQHTLTRVLTDRIEQDIALSRLIHATAGEVEGLQLEAEVLREILQQIIGGR